MCVCVWHGEAMDVGPLFLWTLDLLACYGVNKLYIYKKVDV